MRRGGGTKLCLGMMLSATRNRGHEGQPNDQSGVRVEIGCCLWVRHTQVSQDLCLLWVEEEPQKVGQTLLLGVFENRHSVYLVKY